MNTETVVNGKNSSTVREALDTVGRIAEAGVDVGVLKKRIENAVDDAMVDAERAAKRAKYAFDDTVEDTTHWIKTNPWPSVGYAAAAGLSIGLLAGVLIARPKSRG